MVKIPKRWAFISVGANGGKEKFIMNHGGFVSASTG
jgi:hypothetical protein